MTPRVAPADGPVVLGVLYPAAWAGPPAAFERLVASTRAVDPRLEVVVEPYEEGQHLRTLRGTPDGAAEARALVPPPTDALRAVLARVHAVVAIDLPFDVGTLAPHLAWVQGVGAGYGSFGGGTHGGVLYFDFANRASSFFSNSWYPR